MMQLEQSFVINTSRDVDRAFRSIELTMLDEKKYLFELSIYKDSRSSAQNRLQHHWYNELERQSNRIPELNGMGIDDIRSYNKLRFGVQIMREDKAFSRAWTLAAANLSHQERLEVVFYMPVTSLMNIEQKTRYLNNVYYYWAPKGAVLTTSADYYFEAMGWTR